MDETALMSDPLFVGATRPPMRWGVTYSGLLFNVVLAMQVFLLSKNLLALLIAAPIHGVMALLCARDPRYFDLVMIWARTGMSGALGGSAGWNANAYAPLPLDARGRSRSGRVEPVHIAYPAPVQGRHPRGDLRS